MLSSLQGALPKPTLIAELRDAETFGKALDAIMITVNKELKAMAMEKAAEEEAAGGDGAGGRGAGPGGMSPRGPGRGMAGAGGRPARKRSLKDTPAPEFRLMPGTVKVYMLHVPTDSPLKLTPPGVRPTIRMEHNHIAIATTSEAARTALDTMKKKEWKPSADVEKVLAHVPSGPVLLAVSDPRDTVPGILASLPGTLQASINSAIALSAATSGGNPPGQPGAAPAGGAPAGAGAGMFSKPGMAGRSGYPGAAPPASPAPGGSQAAGQDAMIQLKVDPARLPKAEELKALMFPSTLAIVVDDASIRVVSRESFPNVFTSMGMGAASGAAVGQAMQAARAAAGMAPPPIAPPATAAPASPPAANQTPAAGGGGRLGSPRGGRGGRGGGPGRSG